MKKNKYKRYMTDNRMLKKIGIYWILLEFYMSKNIIIL